MKFRNGTPIIPAGALVYISTDDPDGQCRNCFVKGKACSAYESPKPVGCPEDVRCDLLESCRKLSTNCV